MPIPAALAALGPLFAEAGGAAAGAGLSEAAASAAASEGISGLTQALTAATAGGGGGGGGLTGYGLGGKTPNMPIPGFGLLGKAVTSLIKPITTLPKQIEDWGQSLVDSKRNLMAFNGAIAGSILEVERRDMMRKMDEGKRVSSTTGFMSEGVSGFKDEIQPLKDVVSNGFNLLAGSIMRVASFAAKIAKWHPIIAAILKIQEELALRNQTDARFVKFIDDIQKGDLRQFNDDKNLMPPQGF
jgi:hypothetical protein